MTRRVTAKKKLSSVVQREPEPVLCKVLDKHWTVGRDFICLFMHYTKEERTTVSVWREPSFYGDRDSDPVCEHVSGAVRSVKVLVL